MRINDALCAGTMQVMPVSMSVITMLHCSERKAYIRHTHTVSYSYSKMSYPLLFFSPFSIDFPEAEGTSTETETKWETDYWNENISPILKDLEVAQQGKNVFFEPQVIHLT